MSPTNGDTVSVILAALNLLLDPRNDLTDECKAAAIDAMDAAEAYRNSKVDRSPDFWAVFSGDGSTIGIWDNDEEARRECGPGYQIVPLCYASRLGIPDAEPRRLREWHVPEPGVAPLRAPNLGNGK